MIVVNKMDNIKRIWFKQKDDTKIEIHAETTDGEDIEIGHIFSKDSYSGINSIQVCGFDNYEGPWSCGIYNHSQDCCLIWNAVSAFLREKKKVKEHPK